MSLKHPIIAITGSSGAGSMAVKIAFQHIFHRNKLKAVVIDGDSFHRYDRYEMREAVERAQADGTNLSHFGPQANRLDLLEKLFKQYSEVGTGKRRFYLHTEEQAGPTGQRPGTFTPWEDIPADTDLLFYQGLHGGVVADGIDVTQYVDLLIGVVPSVNMEWIQKINRDSLERGYAREDVTDIILRRMPDYVHYITPQFSLTDINLQRIPTVDTSNPFTAHDVPRLSESLVVIRFKEPKKFHIDLPTLMSRIPGSFTSRRHSLVIPGGKLEMTMEILFTPIIEEIVQRKRRIEVG